MKNICQVFLRGVTIENNEKKKNVLDTNKLFIFI